MVKHGYAKKGMRTKTYRAWSDMRDRCNNPKNRGYQYYGRRDIKVCKRWGDFRNFLEDIGEAPEGLTLERKNNNGNYEPSNCRWATWTEQAQNKRGPKLKLSPLKVQIIKNLLRESFLKVKDIAEIFNVSPRTIYLIKSEKIWDNIAYNESLCTLRLYQ